MPKSLSNDARVGKWRHTVLLSGSLLLRSAGYAGMDALEYVFSRHDPKRLPKFFRVILAFGYWLLGGIATGIWKWPSYPIKQETAPKAG